MSRWEGGGTAGAGGDDGGGGGAGGSGEEQESRAEVAGHDQYRKVVGPCIIHVSTQSFIKIFLVVVIRSSKWQEVAGRCISIARVTYPVG